MELSSSQRTQSFTRRSQRIGSLNYAFRFRTRCDNVSARGPDSGRGICVVGRSGDRGCHGFRLCFCRIDVRARSRYEIETVCTLGAVSIALASVPDIVQTPVAVVARADIRDAVPCSVFSGRYDGCDFPGRRRNKFCFRRKGTAGSGFRKTLGIDRGGIRLRSGRDDVRSRIRRYVGRCGEPHAYGHRDYVYKNRQG